jgi:SAM-dependent methyltransferase
MLVRCRECRHLFLTGGVSEAFLANAYGAEYYGQGDSGSERLGYDDYLRDSRKRMRGFNQRLADLERYVSRPGRLLDFGCAVGLFVRVAQDRGWQAIGYDRSEWAAAYGRDKLGVTLYGGEMPRFEEQSFDLVTMWDCIEHLNEPRHVLEQLRRCLRPGGILAVNTVNSSSFGARLAGSAWRHIAPPLHIHLFSAGSLSRLVSDVGFSLLRRSGEGIVFGAARHAEGGRPAAWDVLNDVVCHWRLKRIASLLNLPDEVFLLARKA